jgi:TolB protein
MTRASPRLRAPGPAGGRRLPIDLAPALSLGGLVIVAAVTFALLGGSLPALPGGPIRSATPSGVVIVDPRADVPGSLLYVKHGNIWLQQGDEARQLTSTGDDTMPAWAPDGASIYFVRTTAESGRWPSGGVTRTYELAIPQLMRIGADGSGEAEVLLTGRIKRGTNTWSYFIREPAISPDGSTAAIVTDGPDPTTSDIVVKLLDLAGDGGLTDPELGQTQSLGHQDPAWSPDGRFLLYVRNAREGARGTPAIYRYNVANARSIAITGGGYADPSWSRDGRFIAATRTSTFGTDVVILDASNGAEVLRVTRDDNSFSPVWSPAGNAIAFFRVVHGVVDLVLVPLEGTGPDWTAGEAISLTISAGLDAAARAAWFIPADQLPPLPTPTPVPSSGPTGTGSGTP